MVIMTRAQWQAFDSKSWSIHVNKRRGSKWSKYEKKVYFVAIVYAHIY